MAQYPIVHVEIPTTDREASGKFYSDLFGWEVQQHAGMNYATFAAEGGPGGGFPTIDGQTVKAGEIKIYVAASDIEETLQRANALGAQTLVEKMEIPGYGFFAFFTDPFGNAIGLFSM